MGNIDNNEFKKLENLYKLKEFSKLEKEVKRLLKIDNKNLFLKNIQGVICLKKKSLNEAENIFIDILKNNPKNLDALKNLGETYRKRYIYDNAIKYYKIYLEQNPKDHEILNNIASCYLKNKRYEEALTSYKILLKKNPKNLEYKTNFAFALIDALNYQEGIKILEEVLGENINNKRAYSGYLSNQHYNPDINYNKINNYIKKYNESYQIKKLNIIEFKFKKDAKKLNIGFISPDFRNHPVGYAIKEVIKNLKIYNYNSYAYYNFHIEDRLTRELKKNFNFFLNISNLEDEQIINKIRSDGIHILVDLAGHTINNNLNIFYYDPAPIQVSWLGYLPTTGIKNIKYKIGDPHIYTKSCEKNFTEKILNLPNIWSNFSINIRNDEANFLFNSSKKEIIFGSFVTLRKINDKVIALWSKVLNRYPYTKIYFKAPELHDPMYKKKFLEKFLKFGVNSERIILEKSSNYEDYLESYAKVHLTLDPFPWNGVTTSFESIWMGSPVFCLKGTSPLSRCTYSINQNLGMYDWIAENEEDYLTKLGKILSNKEKLFLIKNNLRKKAIKNNLFNSKIFTRELSNVFNQVWEDLRTIM